VGRNPPGSYLALGSIQASEDFDDRPMFADRPSRPRILLVLRRFNASPVFRWVLVDFLRLRRKPFARPVSEFLERWLFLNVFHLFLGGFCEFPGSLEFRSSSSPPVARIVAFAFAQCFSAMRDMAARYLDISLRGSERVWEVRRCYEKVILRHHCPQGKEVMGWFDASNQNRENRRD
jgi:hypothetical protein